MIKVGSAGATWTISVYGLRRAGDPRVAPGEALDIGVGQGAGPRGRHGRSGPSSRTLMPSPDGSPPIRHGAVLPTRRGPTGKASSIRTPSTNIWRRLPVVAADDVMPVGRADLLQGGQHLRHRRGVPCPQLEADR